MVGASKFLSEPERSPAGDMTAGQHFSFSPTESLFQTRIAAERIANWQYAVAPDGRFLINGSPLTLISEWDVSLHHR